MTYIVVSENEIVRAEMERPEQKDYNFGHGHNEAYRYNKDLGLWHDHIISLPRIAAPGHKWKVWDEVVEGKDFEFDLKEPEPCYKPTIIAAIPIQPTPEGEKNPTDKQRIEWLEDRVAYLEKLLKIDK